MNKIAIVKKKKEKYVHVKLKSNQMINAREIEMLTKRQIIQLINPEVKIKGNPELFYKVSNYISLKDYLQSVTSKERFLNVVLSILDTLKDSQSIMLYNKNFMLDTEYIFVEPQSKMIMYIYLPIVNYDFEPDIRQFLQNLVYGTVFNHLEDCSYVSEYIAYFRKNVNFSVYDFEMFIREMNGEEVRSGDKKVEVDISHPSKYLRGNIKICPKCNTEYTSTDNFCDLCGSRLVISQSGQKTKMPENGLVSKAMPIAQPASMQAIPVMQLRYSEGTTVLGAVECGTTVLSKEQLGGLVFPYIMRKKDGSRIQINKVIFSIGKSQSSNDYAIIDNSAVSRKHLSILIVNGKYYIKDENSTNGTYIDDVKIEPQKSVEITAGQRLRLADDEFIFSV